MRKHYIDNIRSVTVLLVVIYHVIYIFNSITPGGVGAVTKHAGSDFVQYLLYPWFMVILFLLSGMCSRYYLERHTVKEYVHARTCRLLVPSTLGLFVIGWLQGYLNMEISHAFESIPDTVPGVVMYLIMCMSGVGVLWTIQMMWLFSMLLVPVRKLEKDRLWKHGEKCGMAVLLLLGVLVYGAAQVLNPPVVSVYRFGIYGCVFFLGYFVFSHEAVTDALKRNVLWLSVAAAGLGIAYTVLEYGNNYAVTPSVNCPLAIAYGWLMCLAVIGLMKRFGDRSSAFLRFLAQKSFGLYIFHYYTLSACAYLLVTDTRIRGAICYLLTAVAAFAGGLVLYEIISRIPVLRFCVLGMKKEKKHVS